LILAAEAAYRIQKNRDVRHTPGFSGHRVRLYPRGPQPGPGNERGKVLSGPGFPGKPDLPTALEFMQSGEYYWNSGIFLWRADTFAENLRDYAPECSRPG